MPKTTKTRSQKPANRKAVKPLSKADAPKIAATKGTPAVRSNGRFAGKKLFPSPAVKKANPRRPTAKTRAGKEGASWGFRSLEIIRKSPGITYEAFLRAGGRAVDLRWDAERGRVVARD